MMKSELVFVYGSNMDPAQMRERCPESDLSWFIAEAPGWKLCFPRQSEKRKGGVGSIVEEAKSSVWGVVFTVSERDLLRLDRYEGVGSKAYKRNRIEVLDEHGQHSSAWTYFAISEGDKNFVPHADYIDLYVKGAKYFGLPRPYLDSLKKIREGAKSD
jgi:gamma-glutamylcyclotransferase (GGCT)/AIG2-like uncharacterized protein YtfP